MPPISNLSHFFRFLQGDPPFCGSPTQYTGGVYDLASIALKDGALTTSTPPFCGSLTQYTGGGLRPSFHCPHGGITDHCHTTSLFIQAPDTRVLTTHVIQSRRIVSKCMSHSTFARTRRFKSYPHLGRVIFGRAAFRSDRRGYNIHSKTTSKKYHIPL